MQMDRMQASRGLARTYARLLALMLVSCGLLLTACTIPQVVVPPDGTPSSNAESASANSAARSDEATHPYYYTKSEGVVMASAVISDEIFTALVPQRREVWFGTDGSGRIRQEYGERVFFSAEDEAQWQAAGGPSMSAPMDQSFGLGGIPLDHFLELPTEAAALSQHLEEMASVSGNPLAWQMFDTLGSLLREMPQSEEMRQLLYQVGSEIEGVEVVEESHDQGGRPAIALSRVDTFNEMTTRRTLFFDPESFLLLGEEELLLEPTHWFPAEVGTAIRWIIYVETGYVESTTSGLESTDLAPGNNAPSNQPMPSMAARVGPPQTLDDLLSKAPLILIGEVGPVVQYLDFAVYGNDGQLLERGKDPAGNLMPEAPATDFSLLVEEVLRDDGTIASGETIILRMPGHATEELKQLTAQIDYPFSFTGDRHLFLLTPNPDGASYGFYYGPWGRLILDDEMLRVSDGQQQPLTFTDQPAPITLDDFKQGVAAADVE